MRKIVLSLPLSGICDGRQHESAASGLHRLEWTGFLRFYQGSLLLAKGEDDAC